MMFHVPHADLGRDAVAADDFEKSEIFLIAINPIEVDEGLG